MPSTKVLVIVIVAVVAIVAGVAVLLMTTQKQPTPPFTTSPTTTTSITTPPTTTPTPSPTPGPPLTTPSPITTTTPTSTTSPVTTTPSPLTTSPSPTTPPTTPPPSPSPSPTSTVPPSTTTPSVSGEIVVYTTLIELFSNIKHIKYELHTESPTTGVTNVEGGYTITGETVLNGEDVWLIRIHHIITSENETSETLVDVAVTKDVGKVVKLTITENGETTEITGPQLEFMGTVVLQGMLMPFLIFTGTAESLSLTITEIGIVSSAEGIIVQSVPTTVTIGGKTFNAFKVDFQNLQPESEGVVKGELIIAELYKDHWFLVQIEGYTSENEYGMLKIVEITLAE